MPESRPSSASTSDLGSEGFHPAVLSAPAPFPDTHELASHRWKIFVASGLPVVLDGM